MTGKISLLAATLLLTGATVVTFPSPSAEGEHSSRTIFSHELPNLKGSTLRSEIVAVTYGPGGASPVHSHPCPVIGYVLQGAVRMQVDGEPERVYRQGESFYEAPNGVHRVSANASTNEPAKFLAFFVCDNDAPLSAPVKESHQ